VTDYRASYDVIDSHTAGHPTRVILSGVPRLIGRTVREKRDDFIARFDGLRTLLLHEPRGHAAMVGLVPLASDVADFGAFFISSYVYLDMCGHGTIGYAKTLAATGEISPATGDSFTLETPAGVVTVNLDWSASGELVAVRLANVPSYVEITDLAVADPVLGEVRADIVYGGMWYALVDAKTLGLSLAPDNVSALLVHGSRLKLLIKAAVAGHPVIGKATAPSVLFYNDAGPDESTHLLVLESNKFDRSPCGTGTSARLAQRYARGQMAVGDVYRARNILGVEFLARAAEQRPEYVVAEIEGIAHISARATLFLEKTDPIPTGFLCR
jgi:proline racemase